MRRDRKFWEVVIIRGKERVGVQFMSKECISGYQGQIDLGQIVEPPNEGGRVPKRNNFYNDLSSPPEWLASPWDGE